MFFVFGLIGILWVSMLAYERTGEMLYGWVMVAALVAICSICLG